MLIDGGGRRHRQESAANSRDGGSASGHGGAPMVGSRRGINNGCAARPDEARGRDNLLRWGFTPMNRAAAVMAIGCDEYTQ
jgi:hypothetical protein